MKGLHKNELIFLVNIVNEWSYEPEKILGLSDSIISASISGSVPIECADSLKPKIHNLNIKISKSYLGTYSIEAEYQEIKIGKCNTYASKVSNIFRSVENLADLESEFHRNSILNIIHSTSLKKYKESCVLR